MTIWLDAQLSPLLAEWIHQTFQIQASLPDAIAFILSGEPLVEISDKLR